MSQTARLSQLEVECLNVLWRKKTARVADVQSSMPRPLAYTTVMTVLDRMMAKGVVVRQKNGRAYVYSPALDLEAARIAAVQRLLDNLFNHDPHALVQFLQREAGPADQAKASRQRKPVPVRMAGRVHIDDSLL